MGGLYINFDLPRLVRVLRGNLTGIAGRKLGKVLNLRA